MTKIKLFHVCCFCKAVASGGGEIHAESCWFYDDVNLLCPLTDLYFVNLTPCNFGFLLFL